MAQFLKSSFDVIPQERGERSVGTLRMAGSGCTGAKNA
jgi:hypothetical protein